MTPGRITRVQASLSLVALFLSTTALLAAPSRSSIDTTVKRAMDEFDVPGMAVSVVFDGNLYYAAGHGIREIGEDDAVNERTLFQIASVSKAFTAAALAVLVDEGKLAWDDPVIDYLPDFRMYDPWVTREFTIRDLLTHRSGLPLGAGDLLLFPKTSTTRDEVVRAMRHLKPSSSFRSKFDYDNLLYIIAGEVVSAVAQASYEAFVEERLLHPLGMSDCSASFERVPAGSSKATPHVMVGEELQITESLQSTLAAAAGGVNCNAASMASWLSFFMNEGRAADGTQLISEIQMGELLNPVTLLPPRAYFREHAGTFLNAYALGWNVSSFYGQPMYSHAGGLWGMTSYVAILPEQGLAVFASNNQMSPAPLAIVNDVLHKFLHERGIGGEQDWIALIAAVSGDRQADARVEVARVEASRAANSKPSLSLEAYAGTYRDPWYGDIRITLEAGQLWFHSERSEVLSGPLAHFQYDTFVARWVDRKLNADAYVSFTLTADGGVERIRMQAVSPATDFSFDFHDLDLVRIDVE